MPFGPLRTRAIAEAKVKTDKIAAEVLAQPRVPWFAFTRKNVRMSAPCVAGWSGRGAGTVDAANGSGSNSTWMID